MILSRSLKPVMRQTIEDGIARYKNSAASLGFKQVILNDRIKMELLSEIYAKYFTMLHLNRANRLLLTPAQGCALWLAWGDLHDDCDTPELGNLMMQLHQKLI